MATAFLEVGETVTLEVGPDRQQFELEVGEACERSDFGKWFCSRCRFGLTNFELDGHRSHGLVWMCFEHGPESVPEAERA
jgi:hypothetical protein